MRYRFGIGDVGYMLWFIDWVLYWFVYYGWLFIYFFGFVM